MPDITFDDLINARAAETVKAGQPDGAGGFLNNMTQEGLMELGQTALSILQEFKNIQGASGGVLASRGTADQTSSQTEASKPVVDVDQIKEALEMVKNLKGDITVSAMLKLLEENKAVVAGFIKDV